MARFEVGYSVSYTRTAIIDVDSLEEAESWADGDPVGVFQEGLEQGDLPYVEDVTIEWVQPVKEKK